MQYTAKQRELIEWVERSLPDNLQDRIQAAGGLTAELLESIQAGLPADLLAELVEYERLQGE